MSGPTAQGARSRGVVDQHPVLEASFRKLRSASQRALLLDYDGTLAPFRVDRDAARPYDGVAEVIGALAASATTRVAVISGRSVDSLLPLLSEVHPLPEVWGVHGWERRSAQGVVTYRPLPESAARALARVARWADGSGWGSRCEHKSAGLAFHWRGVDDRTIQEMQDQIHQACRGLLGDGGLELLRFDGGVEVRASGWNKGDAVRALLAEWPPEAFVAYAGDDLTDEDAFAALRGRGLRILVRTEERETDADVRLCPPEELLWFLREWARVCAEAQ
jgi:trehalose-phosphatase